MIFEAPASNSQIIFPQPYETQAYGGYSCLVVTGVQGATSAGGVMVVGYRVTP